MNSGYDYFFTINKYVAIWNVSMAVCWLLHQAAWAWFLPQVKIKAGCCKGSLSLHKVMANQYIYKYLCTSSTGTHVKLKAPYTCKSIYKIHTHHKVLKSSVKHPSDLKSPEINLKHFLKPNFISKFHITVL